METCSDVLLFLHCFQINDCDHVCPFKNKIVEGALSGSNSDLDSKFSSHLVFLWPFQSYFAATVVETQYSAYLKGLDNVN